MSVTIDRVKYRNLSRQPWAALHISREDFFAHVVLEGSVELTPVATRADDEVVEELVEYYRAAIGETDPRASATDGLRDVALCQSVVASARSAAVVTRPTDLRILREQ